MAEVASLVVCDRPRGLGGGRGGRLAEALLHKPFKDVPELRGPGCSRGRIPRIIGQEVAVVFQVGPAARRIGEDRVESRWVDRVELAPGKRLCGPFSWRDRPDFTCFQNGSETAAIARGVADELGPLKNTQAVPEVGPWAPKKQ